MAEVHLRRITADNERECLDLRVDDAQAKLVATNARSLAQAKANPRLVPLGVYDRAACGYAEPRVPMVGFVLYEIDCGVGSILRLMIDRKYQRRGYGRAALVEVIRRLRLEPEVEMVVTSHRHDNAVVATLFRSLGFIPWELEGIASHPGRSTCDYLKVVDIAGRSAPNFGTQPTALRPRLIPDVRPKLHQSGKEGSGAR